MREILLATAIAAVVLLAQVGVRYFVSPSWIGVGLLAIAVGLLVSVPAAIMYHLRLYAALGARGALSPGWIWNPTRLHPRLLEDERKGVMPWFYAGVTGWVITVTGAALVGLAVWLL